MKFTRAQTIELLDLPVEVRLRIYRLQFTTHGNFKRDSSMEIHRRSDLLVKARLWPLFLVCKQIYYEIAPEYYASTSFYFFPAALLGQTLSGNALFRASVRHVVLDSFLDYIPVKILLSLTNLKTFVVLGTNHQEPYGTARGKALEFSTLKMALRDQTLAWYRPTPVLAIMKQYNAMTQNRELRERGIRLLFRFTYAYSEENELSGRECEVTYRAYRRVIEYDYTDDTFSLRYPKDREERVIMAPLPASEPQV